jgi:hypothetical protein
LWEGIKLFDSRKNANTNRVSCVTEVSTGNLDSKFTQRHKMLEKWDSFKLIKCNLVSIIG